jgi:hypothetical protein
MRTTGKIAVIIGIGLLLAGAGSVVDTSLVGSPAAVAAVRGSARPVPAASAATRTVTYAGYEITVPADWPVYRLDTDPVQCVRYDIHAVYLGTPGTGQQCPAGLIGRTETVSIIPIPAGTVSGGTVSGGTVPGSTAAPSGSTGSGRTVAAGPAGPAGPAATDTGGAGRSLVTLPGGVRGEMRSDTAVHEITVAVGAPGGTPSGGAPRTPARQSAVTAGASVVATYGADPALIEQVLGTLRPAPAGRSTSPATSAVQGPAAPAVPAWQPSPLQDGIQAPGAQASGAGASGALASGIPALGAQAIGARELGQRAAADRVAGAQASAPQPTTTQWHGLPSSWPTVLVEPDPAPVAPARRPLPGFDACTAPSLPTMKAWRRGFAVVGIYIGGVNAACDYGNLSASWITSAAAMGWAMLPAYVGPQAPCTGYGNLIMPSRAAAEGGAAADDAVRDAMALGLPKGSPIYYDMEAYSGGASCSAAVLAFLSAWTRQLTVRGYISGVYSSKDSGIADMQAAAVAKLAGFTAPQAVWIASWDGSAALGAGSPPWPLTARSKQYIGPHDLTIGGFTLNIDTDLVGGPVLSGG